MNLFWPRKSFSKPKDQKLMLMRRATSKAVEKYGIGGREKTTGAPKKITMPKYKFMEDES
jgi:hypothetical protein